MSAFFGLNTLLINSFPICLEGLKFSGLDGGPHIPEKGLIKMEIMQSI